MNKRFEITETWVYKRMLRMPWTGQVSNEEVFMKSERKETLIHSTRRKQVKFIVNLLKKICKEIATHKI